MLMFFGVLNTKKYLNFFKSSFIIKWWNKFYWYVYSINISIKFINFILKSHRFVCHKILGLHGQFCNFWNVFFFNFRPLWDVSSAPLTHIFLRVPGLNIIVFVRSISYIYVTSHAIQSNTPLHGLRQHVLTANQKSSPHLAFSKDHVRPKISPKELSGGRWKEISNN